MCQSLNVNQIVFGSHQEVDVMLYSGNLNFLRSKSQLLLSKSILLLNTPWKSRGFLRFGTKIGIRWRVYEPDHYGGPVSVRILMGFFRVAPVDMSSACVRTIVHFLNFGERPDYFDPSKDSRTLEVYTARGQTAF